MPGLNINFGSSVIKRETRDFDEVSAQLRNDGWTQTGSIGDRIKYFQKTGFNITAVRGPMGTVLFPSGPIRGRMFGQSGAQIQRDTVLGTGRIEGEEGRQKRLAEEMSKQIT